MQIIRRSAHAFTCQRLLHLISYLKLFAALSDLDGWTIFYTGCSGCWSLRRRNTSFKREDTKACKLSAAISRSLAVRSPLTYNVQAWGCYVHLLTILPVHVLPVCVMSACLMPTWVIPVCVMPICILPLCVMSACVILVCVKPFYVIPACVMPFCVLLLCVMPFRVLTSCVFPFCSMGYLQNWLVAMLLRIDAFLISMILFQLLSIEFCHRYTSIEDRCPHRSERCCCNCIYHVRFLGTCNTRRISRNVCSRFPHYQKRLSW